MTAPNETPPASRRGAGRPPRGRDAAAETPTKAYVSSPRRWGVGGWLVAAAAGLVAAGGLVGLLVWDRRLFLLAVGWMCSLWLAYRIPNRNLIAELANRDASIDAWNLSAKRTDLDQVGPASPPRGTEVVPYDQDDEREWVDIVSGVASAEIAPGRPTDHTGDPEWTNVGSGGEPGWLGPDQLEHRFPAGPMSVAETDRLIASLQALPGDERPPAANGLHVSRGWGDDPFAPGCGCLIAHCGLVIPQAGCAQHDNGKSFRQAHRVEECPVYSGCPFAECPHPGNCGGECRWDIDPDCDASDGPRSLPAPRLSD